MYKILVADDDVDLLDIVELFLQRRNFTVAAISRWQDIFSTVNEFDPDLILLDISLGTADGREICKQLKTTKQTEKKPVLLYSAFFDEHTLPDTLADGFIEKPFQFKNLENKIHSILGYNQTNMS